MGGVIIEMKLYRREVVRRWHSGCNDVISLPFSLAFLSNFLLLGGGINLLARNVRNLPRVDEIHKIATLSYR